MGDIFAHRSNFPRREYIPPNEMGVSISFLGYKGRYQDFQRLWNCTINLANAKISRARGKVCEISTWAVKTNGLILVTTIGHCEENRSSGLNEDSNF